MRRGVGTGDPDWIRTSDLLLRRRTERVEHVEGLPQIGLPSKADSCGFRADLATRVRRLAVAVRSLGNGYRRNPENLVTERERIEAELLSVARAIAARG